MEISGKVALVTGGANGIGEAIVKMLLQKNARGVCIVDINKKKGQELKDSLQKTWGQPRVLFVKCDVTSDRDLRSAFVAAKKNFGRLDIVCNNADILNESKCEYVIAVNLTAMIKGTYLAVEFMGTKKGGSGGVVINTSSFGGLASPGCHNIQLYGATKHGVVGFTRSVANEPMVTGNNVRVSALCPPIVLTNMAATSPKQTRDEKNEDWVRKLRPNDVANIVMELIEGGQYNGCACVIYRKMAPKIIPEAKL